MPDTKQKDELPEGFQLSDGKTPINGAVHDKGVIVGPQERTNLIDYACDRCKSKVKAPEDQAPVCQGAILAMIDVKGIRGEKGAVIRSGYDDDGEAVLLPGSVPTLDDNGGKNPEHPPTIMKAVK